MDKIKSLKKQLKRFIVLSFLTYNVLIYCTSVFLLKIDMFSELNYFYALFLYMIIALLICNCYFNYKFNELYNENSEVDVLTSLYNIKTFELKVNEKIKQAPNKIGGMLFIDIDNIKFINDKFGHDVGNEFIVEMSRMLTYFDKYDGISCRVSGDEFIVYVHGFENEKELFKVFEGLYEFGKDFCVKTSDEIINKIRFSSGVAYYPKDATKFCELYKLSDFALHCAKNTEKGRVLEFDKKNYKENYYILENSRAINQLIDNKLVRFAYQPIVDLKTGEVYAYEALLRSKMECFKSPLEIIDVASSQAKLPHLESLVIFTIYENIKKHEEILGDKKIFLNTLPNQVLSVEEGALLVEKYDKYFSKVVVEITEQENNNKINMDRKVNFLRKYSIGIAVDDFGNGFSNEVRILELMPNVVKIDMELIQGISNNSDKQTIVSNLVEFCHGKNIKVVAEGVEECVDLEYVCKLGIDFVQGFYVSKPNFEFIDIPKEIKDEILRYSN